MKLSPEALAIRRELKKADISPYDEEIDKVRNLLTLENCRPSTLCNYISYLKLFAAWLVLLAGAPAFSLITVDTVRKYLDFLKTGQELAPNTINGYLAAIRKLFSFLRDEELSKRAVPDLVVDEHMPRVPSVKQVLAMLKACICIREQLFIGLLISTGVRLNELVGLRFADIRKEDRVIYISADAKGRSDGYVPLSDRVMSLLTDYCREYNASHPKNRLKPEDYIFFKVDRHGNADPTRHESDARMRDVFIGIQTRAGLETEHFRPHAMRHFFAFQLYLQSHDLFLVKHLLRHRTLAATLKYLVMASSIDVQSKYTNPGDIAFGQLDSDMEVEHGDS